MFLLQALSRKSAKQQLLIELADHNHMPITWI